MYFAHKPIFLYYKMIRRYIIGILCLLALMACTEKHSRLEQALEQAGTHRAELESVLQHYQNELQKRAAAEFLIANMPEQYTLDGPFLDRYYELLDSLQACPEVDHEDMRAFYDSIYQSSQWQTLTKVYDLQTIQADYLIGHIDAAFEAWQSPWARSLSFEEFCEYLLPYRVGNERLEPWMQDFRAKYQPVVDSVGTDCIDSVYAAIAGRIVGHRYFTPAHIPDFRPSSLEGMRIGSCRSYGAWSFYIFRSLGIPIIHESTPNWSNHAMGHEWTTLVVDGKNYPIQLGDADPLGTHVERFVYRPSKIYRDSYGSYRPLIENETDVPELFSNPKLKDMTAAYIPVTDVVLEEVFPLSGRKPAYAYLTVFDQNSWKPVAYGKRDRSGYRFEDMGRNAVYLPVYFHEGKYYPAYHPVRVDEAGTLTVLEPDTLHRQSVILWRKFMDRNPKLWADDMAGGCFVFGKDLRFTESDTLWVDTLQEYAFQTRTIEGQYRCMKYVPPMRTKGNLAEIEVYDQAGKRVEGRVMGNYNPGWLDSMVTMSRAFDGDVLSFTSAGPDQTDAWLGLDFGRMVEVSRLIYLPRTDDNFIREGELYELFYWDKGWQSLGKQTGSRKLQYLTYDNVPGNALLLLRNLTKGKEERIFTYEDGKQVWW